MTACVKNHSKRVALAISASLVGALSLGAAPVAAMAVESGIDTQASVSAADAFSQGTVSLSETRHEYNGTVFAPTVTSVTPRGGNTIDEDEIETSDDYKVYYVKADEDGKPTDEVVAEPIDAGNYCVVVEAVSGDYEGGKAYAKFSISGLDLSSATATEDGRLDDFLFTYDAEPAGIGFALGQDALREGVDYTVKFYNQGEDWNNSALGSDEAPTDAGDYYAHVEGIGAYAGSSADVKFSIDKCDLTKSDVVAPIAVGKTSSLPTAPTTVNGSEALAAKVKLVYTGTPGELGAYTAKVVPAEDDDPNFAASSDTKNISVYKVASNVTFTYDGKPLGDSLTVNLANGETFDASKIKATYVDASGKTQEVQAGSTTGQAGTWTMHAYRSDGSDTVAGDLNGAGRFSLVFTANPTSPWDFGGTAQVDLTITKGVIDCAKDLVVNYGGKIVTSIDKMYDGTDAKSGINVTLYDGDNALTYGTDYKVIYKDAEGNEVSQIVDAGEYTMEVVSDTYTIQNGTFKITVTPYKIAAIRIAADENNSDSSGTMLETINGRYALNYTGSSISPKLEYTTGERDANGDLTWKPLSGSIAESYVLISYTMDGKTVKQVKDLGSYELVPTLSKASGSENFTLSAEPYEFEVDESLTFLDVPSGEWYYDYVIKADKLDYMKGYGDTKYFGPTDKLTRAQAAVVLYNMAGGDSSLNNLEETDQYEQAAANAFGDVDATFWGAKEIGWAVTTGVVEGYQDGSGNFGPNDYVTREQFAKMLSNYAALRGDDVAGAEADLSQYPDADSVDDWAAEAMEWAVSEGVMGGNVTLNPTDAISRAEVAKMAVTYQPAKLNQ